MNYLTLKQAAEITGMTPRRLQQMCSRGDLQGAVKQDGTWMIPENARLPKRTRERKKTASLLPLGLTYEEAVRNSIVIDKSLLIRDLLFSQTKITLFTRPRRFGKSLNLDMIRCFFESGHPERNDLFHGKAISAYPDITSRHQGKYPVIALPFLGMDSPFEDIVRKVGLLVYESYKENKKNLTLDNDDKDFFASLGRGDSKVGDVEISLRRLISCFVTPPIVLIDEYDSPMQFSYLNGEYDKTVSFFRNFLGLSLKDNPKYFFAVLTGVSRMAKESVFSGFNSAKINGVGSLEYASYFGFTEEETRSLFRQLRALDHFDEAKEYYDGYRFGMEKVFNPWSVANYVNNRYRADYYWANTSNNAIIQSILENRDPATIDFLTRLMAGETLYGLPTQEEHSYKDLETNADAIWPILLSSGYLSIDESAGLFVPNKEARHCFEEQILSYVQKGGHISQNALVQSLETADIDGIERILDAFIKTSVSNLLSYKEDFYHGLLLGMLAYVGDRYEVRSEYEVGNGRSDIILLPKSKGPQIIIEVKRLVDADHSKLELEANIAIKQIIHQGYLQSGYDGILYGIAFCKKTFVVKSEIRTK